MRGPSVSSSSIEEGQRAYIERINILGNTRTRDYVIRREFDISEGDAYNRALVNRAERRLKNLSYFKNVQDPDRARLGARPRHPQRRARGDSRPANSPYRADIRRRTASWPKSASPSATCSAADSTPKARCNTASMPRASRSRSSSPISWATASRSASTSSPSSRARRATSPISRIPPASRPGLVSHCERTSASRSATRSTGNRSRCRTS